ncbi:MAG: YgiQ family radical SAM protein [Clostridia bacterium]|nr:YgiQ family radical SAM protein [Clostridia bacterium]
MTNNTDFLPISKEDMLSKGWNEVDFVVVTGDCYVDHPSFGSAIISRVLENEGFRVGIIARPDTKDPDAFKVFGKPRLGFMVGSGVIDSMVLNYTVAKKRRSEDLYAPKGYSISRPDRALTVYSKQIKKTYPDCPIIIGGIEASLRRFAHYDYWDDKVRPSVMLDCGADLLTYGMGEKQTVEIANRLRDGESIKDLTDIRGTCYVARDVSGLSGTRLHSYKQVCSDKAMYAADCKVQLEEQDHVTGKRLIQEHDNKFIVQNPPMPPLKTHELDAVYALPYARTYHPIYEPYGGVDAIKEVRFSITHNRGCFSACNFCALNFHQGRSVTSRSEESVVEEAKLLTTLPDFKGYIHDVGGPTANFRHSSCQKQLKSGMCKNKRCLAPQMCKNLEVDHSEYLSILRKLRALKGVKRVFVRSGIRFDYLIADKDKSFFKELVEHHISGQLKVAPEHCSAAVLELMGKPYISSYKEFSKQFYQITGKLNKEQYLVPYLMSSHPGSTLKSAVELALFLKSENIRPQQVQDFYPTPGTISTCMFYTGLNPYTMAPVFVPKSPHEKALQRALLQYFLPQNRALVIEALQKAGRTDLIGNDAKCLIRHGADTRSLAAKNVKSVKQNSHRSPKKGGGHKWQKGKR